MPALMLMWGNTSPDTRRSSSFSSQPSLYGSTSTVNSIQNDRSNNNNNSGKILPRHLCSSQQQDNSRVKSRSMSHVGGVVHCGRRKCSDCTPTLSLKSLVSPRRRGRTRRNSEMDTTSYGGPSPTSSRRGSRISGLNLFPQMVSPLRSRNSLSPPRLDFFQNHSRSRSDLVKSTLKVPDQSDIKQSQSHDVLTSLTCNSNNVGGDNSNNNNLLLPNGDVSIFVPNIIATSTTKQPESTCDSSSNNNIKVAEDSLTPLREHVAQLPGGSYPGQSPAAHHCSQCGHLSTPVSPVSTRGRVISLTESGYDTLTINRDGHYHRPSVFSIYEEHSNAGPNTAQNTANNNIVKVESESGPAHISSLLHKSQTSDDYTPPSMSAHRPQLLSINGHLIRDQRKISNFSLISDTSIGILVSIGYLMVCLFLKSATVHSNLTHIRILGFLYICVIGIYAFYSGHCDRGSLYA